MVRVVLLQSVRPHILCVLGVLGACERRQRKREKQKTREGANNSKH